ncbi:pyridoxamine 5'-phosphate oxidase family protein [Candidatus Bathycorpusculum sp.]|uniref:pyridoxamine 5'-phosphate oxidase family protein n=1 Tax=Candidatus Bathycorpusculum sp. TaxID=2994959 RepID=UPI00282E7B47|nr:pyridoxamine 5'-phosphate oxidase family protein [Candidatus Termitimicrobium sp.]MCL2432141.1 pyridoxamine 5'-phosphate oxidase family protein [Candidatus Termitimicrobium sp.]
MDYLKNFNEVMAESMVIALASSANDVPNVRIVNFIYENGRVYIATGKSAKLAEFKQNNKAAFTTIPQTADGTKHVRVKTASAKKSEMTVADIHDRFVAKLPFFEMIFTQMGHEMEIWEICFNEADVIVDMQHEGKIKL